jgi:hypothetical protein
MKITAKNLKLDKFKPWREIIDTHSDLLKQIHDLEDRLHNLSRMDRDSEIGWEIDDLMDIAKDQIRHLHYYAHPHSDCCEISKKVRLARYANDYFNPNPCWQIFFNSGLVEEMYATSDRSDEISPYQNVLYCPYCGEKLPEMELVEFPKSVKIAKYGEDYCETCKERNMNCICLPPDFAYIKKDLINE